MSDSVNPVPEHCGSVTPYLIIKNASQAMEFYKKAFDAEVLMVLDDPSGNVGHAEIRIGDSVVMLADEYPDMGVKGPASFGGSPISIMLYVEDVDEVFAKAIAAGAEETRPIEDKFYGDRMGSLKDPFGHSWHIGSQKEKLSIDEVKERMAAEFK